MCNIQSKPLELNKYSNGKIYEILCNITKERYIGSTVQRLSQRIHLHRTTRKCCSRQIIDREDYTVKALEDYPCYSRKQLLIKEQEYIDKLECINLLPAHQRDVKQQRKDYLVKYNTANRDKINEYQKLYKQHRRRAFLEQPVV